MSMDRICALVHVSRQTLSLYETSPDAVGPTARRALAAAEEVLARTLRELRAIGEERERNGRRETRRLRRSATHAAE